MGKNYRHLGPAERDRIAALQKEGHSLRTIASVLGVAHSTLSRELQRNRYKDAWQTPAARRGVYDPAYAHLQAVKRRDRSRFQGMKVEAGQALRTFVVRSLMDGWNPDEIAGYLRRHQQCPRPCGEDGCGLAYVSKTALYDWLRSGHGQPYCQYLPSRRYRRKRRRGTGVRRVLIPDRVPLAGRPGGANLRTEPGHWEGDTVVSARSTGGKAALAVFVERHTRLVTAQLIPDMRPESFTAAGIGCLGGKQVRTLTLDNGQENRHHRLLTAATGARVYFADPYSSWQKGSVEHANKLLRNYFPKGSDLGQFDQDHVEAACARLNNKPRKILGYKSALQLAAEKGVITGSTSGALEG